MSSYVREKGAWTVVSVQGTVMMVVALTFLHSDPIWSIFRSIIIIIERLHKFQVLLNEDSQTLFFNFFFVWKPSKNVLKTTLQFLSWTFYFIFTYYVLYVPLFTFSSYVHCMCTWFFSYFLKNKLFLVAFTSFH